MGNIAASGKNLAMFHRDLFAPATDTRQPLLKPETAKAMRNFSYMNAGYGSYGLGLFDEPYYQPLARFPWEGQQLYMFGHPGQDWASGAAMASYNPHFGFAVAGMANAITIHKLRDPRFS